MNAANPKTTMSDFTDIAASSDYGSTIGTTVAFDGGQDNNAPIAGFCTAPSASGRRYRGRAVGTLIDLIHGS